MEGNMAEIIIAIIASAGASSGFWTWMMKRGNTKSAQTRLLLGLAHDRIIFLGMGYIRRGWVTKDEFEDFEKYLWQPYSEFGGNGLAERVWSDVKALRLVAPQGESTPVHVVNTKENNDGTYFE